MLGVPVAAIAYGYLHLAAGLQEWLGLPLVSVLLATLLLMSDGLDVMPLVIVAVVVAYVGRARLDHLVPGHAGRVGTAAAAPPP